MARVQVLNETGWQDPARSSATLWLQWCRYIHEDGQVQYGYRFMWKRASFDDSAPQSPRGQARIPSVEILERLVRQARSEGWGDFDAERISSSLEAHWAQGPKPSS